MPEIKNSTYQKFCPTVFIFHSMYVEACFAKAAQLRKHLFSPHTGGHVEENVAVDRREKSPGGIKLVTSRLSISIMRFRNIADLQQNNI